MPSLTFNDELWLNSFFCVEQQFKSDEKTRPYETNSFIYMKIYASTLSLGIVLTYVLLIKMATRIRADVREDHSYHP